MTRYSFDVPCKGCQSLMKIRFHASKGFKMLLVPAVCPKCESTLEVRIVPGLVKRQAHVKVTLKKHSDKLLDILAERRRVHAKDHTL